jgi:acyl-CoA thioesterase
MGDPQREESDGAFVRETNVRPAGTGRFDVDISPAWNIGENPNGGYVLASVVRAMAEAGGHVTPLSVTGHFLRPAAGGAPGVVEVEVVRSGRSLSTVEGRLVQDDKERLRVLAAFGDAPGAELGEGEFGAGESVGAVPEAPSLPAPDDCPSRAELAQGIELPLLDRVDVRIHPAFVAPGTADRAEMGGYIRFTDDQPPDVLALLQFCDAFPPSPFSLLGQIGWVPTIELTVHLRRRPVDGWISAWFRAHELAGGYFVEDGVLWDESGLVVAQCRQLALLRRDQ